MKNIAFIAFFVLHAVLSAQTIGISEVTAVESKAALYEGNEEKINQIRNKIPELEKRWKDNIAKLRDELAALNKERDNLIADMKIGARCSQCGGWKSDFEKRGENFEKHLGEVKGYAIPATTAEIETTRKSFSEKTAIKKVQLQNLEKGDPAIIKQYDEIEKIKKNNIKLCEEITQHSKNYEKKLVDDAQSKHKIWLEDVMISGSKALIQSSSKKILLAKKGWLEKEFNEKKETELARIKENNAAQRDQNKQKIAENELLIAQLDAEQEMQGIQTIKEQNRALSVEITQLVADLTKNQIQKTKELQEEFNLKIASLKKLEAESEIMRKQFSDEFDAKLKQYKQKQDAFTKEITSENNRMLLAAKKINCSVWNETPGKVNLNWNKLIPCVNMFAFPDTVMIQEVVGGSTCTNEPFFQSGTSVYKSFFEGLAAKEQKVLVN
ncbi:hypothetical protein [Chryseobacterium koreense]|uniref:hypothetical protein n=1 Tax=Chryseobacterium koreense TaxID=232216 RepID=UPI0026EB4FA2|nr:hypothetical protein [Chryseobacterium koreense]